MQIPNPKFYYPSLLAAPMMEECIAPGRSETDKFDRAKKICWLDMDAINSARVLMVGAGAIGNEVAKNLVLSGFRDITIVDMDRVENSNITRCLFFSEADVECGGMKADIVSSGMVKLDRSVKAKSIIGRIQDQGEDFIGNFDIVLGCLDNMLARLHLNAQSCHLGIPYIDGAMDGLRGKVQVVIPGKTACLECAMNRSHGRIVEQRFSCTGNSISLFVPKIAAEITTTSVIGALQVREAVKIVSGRCDKCLKNVAYYDGMRNSLDTYEVERNPDCPNHAGKNIFTG